MKHENTAKKKAAHFYSNSVLGMWYVWSFYMKDISLHVLILNYTNSLNRLITFNYPSLAGFAIFCFCLSSFLFVPLFIFLENIKKYFLFFFFNMRWIVVKKVLHLVYFLQNFIISKARAKVKRILPVWPSKVLRAFTFSRSIDATKALSMPWMLVYTTVRI